MIRRKPVSIWTEELDAIVLQRWNDGESSGMIARAHNLTRNQVIGRLSRLAAAKRAVPLTRIKSAPGPQRPPRAAVLAETAMPAASEPEIPDPVLVNGEPLRFTDSSDRVCRWIVGPASASAVICGHPPKSGSPYCSGHATKAYQPQHDQSRRHAQAKKTAAAAG